MTEIWKLKFRRQVSKHLLNDHSAPVLSQAVNIGDERKE